MKHLFFIIFFLFAFNYSHSQTFTNTIGGAIPPNNIEQCFPVTVSGVGNINATTFGLEKVVININHLSVGELEVVLRSPTGTRIPLVTRRGFIGDNFVNTCFSANNAIPISSGTAPFTGNYFPESSFGVLNNGQNADGVWNICIRDIFNNATSGTLVNFSLTFSNNPMPVTNPPTVQDCPAAIAICRPVYNEINSYVGVGNISNEIRGGVTCIGMERNSVWYTFTAQTTGIVSFVITPNVLTEDYDWAVFNLTNAKCSEIATNPSLTVRCNFSGAGGPTGPNGGTGSQFSPTLPVQAGETYVINVSHFTNTSNGYTIDFSASTALVFDTSKATITSAIPQNKCGTDKINIGFSENVVCSSVNVSDISITGPGGPYTVLSFNSPNCLVNSSYSKSGVLNVSPAMNLKGTYQVCITPSTGSLADLCGNTGIPGCISFSIDTTIVPVFNAIPPFCQNSASPLLPSVSINGVTGTWSPALINNTVSGTYTFTANAPQCPFPATLSVTVLSRPNLGPDKNIAICPSQFANLAGQFDTTKKIVQWSIGGLPVPDSTNVTQPGNYQIIVTDSNACKDTALVKVVGLTNTTDSMAVSVCQNQLPYNWNGQNLNNSGLYKDTIINAAGCDSIRILNLSVNAKSYSSVSFSICTSQLPFLWNNNSYSTAGTYKDSIPNSVGCDSVITLQLTVTSELRDTTNIAICSSQLPFNWNGNNLYTAGTYYDTIVNINGCDSLKVLHLTTLNEYKDSANILLCSSSLPFTWQGISINSSGIYKDTLNSIYGCDSIIILKLDILPSSFSNTNISLCQQSLPYNFNGQLLTSAGVYKDTLFNAVGCDSIVTLTLNVLPATSSITNASICSQQLPYIWNGNNYNNSGIYKDTLTNTQGCDSVITLNLIVKPNSSSLSNASVCPNQLPYNWNGVNYFNAGVYLDTLTNAAGCDSVVTLNLSIKNTTSDTLKIIICSSQLPYVWNGISYNTTGLFRDTFINAQGCDSIITLDLKTNPSTFSNSTVSICLKNLPYTWNGKTLTTAGIFKDTLVNSKGCDSIISLNLITINNSSSTSNITICPKQLPFLWNNKLYYNSGSYKDTIPNTGGCDSIIILNLSIKNNSTGVENIAICPKQLPFIWNGITYNTAGTYTITKTGINGCDSVITFNLSVKSNSFSTANVSVCSDQLPFLWNGQPITTAGIYRDTLMNAVGCDSILILNLTVQPISFSSTTINVCPNQLPYLWNGKLYTASGVFKDTLTNFFGCDSILTLFLNIRNNSSSIDSIRICNEQLPFFWNGKVINASGTYTVLLTNTAGCDSVATLNVIVKAIPQAPVVSSNSPVCSGEVIYLTSNTAPSNLVYWTGPAGFKSTQPNPEISNSNLSNRGTYSAYIVSDGCKSPLASIPVEVIQRPLILSAPDKQVYEGDTIQIIPTITSSTSDLMFRWSPTTYFLSPDTIKSPFILGVKTTRYNLVVTTKNNCSSNIGSFLVKVYPRIKPLQIPNAFSPNNDGVNDTWIIKDLNAYPDALVQVFNRSGNMVFTSSGYAKPWDGTYNGKVLPAATYYYMITTHPDRKPISGWVVLLK